MYVLTALGTPTTGSSDAHLTDSNPMFMPDSRLQALMKQAHTELIDFEGKLTTGELTENWRPKRHEWLRKVQVRGRRGERGGGGRVFTLSYSSNIKVRRGGGRATGQAAPPMMTRFAWPVAFGFPRW